MDMLDWSSRWLGQQSQRFSRKTVRFLQDGDRVSVVASIGTTFFEVDSGFGTVERLEARDYLVDYCEMIVLGRPALPKSGSRFEEQFERSDRIEIYEVMPFGNEPHFRWHDPYQRRLRIHTKHVETIDG